MSCTSFSDFLEVTDDALAGKDKKRDGHLCGHCHPVNYITIAQLHVKDSWPVESTDTVVYNPFFHITNQPRS